MSMQDETIEIGLTVNGRSHRLAVPASATLLDVLHDFLALTGTKKGCDMGSCGACTVLLDGRRVNACLALAAQQEGREILTIEGVAREGALHPLQAAFIARDALQCGYCTPGQIMSALGLIAEGGAQNRAIGEAEIRENMSGNLCRCGAYANIVSAIVDAWSSPA
ncbi:MAG TPA: (2Fe-2S)-binding protein [Reyranella sp.]|jgi:xanthine dehydrogenase YagT iron-sulfur-binding subunit|nr:(2Fe-2S)-binding protein [Reyranella sp.]